MAVFYLPQGREIEIFRHAWRSRLPLLVKGPTGCGKTRFIQHMAEALERPLITVSCNEDTSATDLLGRHLLLEGETRWSDGPVTRAVREGALLYLDEIAEARADAVVVIHSLSDHRRELFLDRTGETLEAPDDFMLVVSYNPGYQRSMREMKPSTRQRFVSLSFDFPAEENEVRIVAEESGVEPKIAERLVRIGRKIRHLHELSLLESASTRLLVAAGKLIAAGVPPRLACVAAVAEPLTDEPEALAAMRQVIELSI
ncbi:MAG: CbbQ/NirQ/NorQ/GpvN family protein [Akkermansiaceae bacterium]|nr:CbbQ/NirQ/NorQ/GpvN family protein [Akkermansiaceae bacterium]MCP5551513.1 CbbQ/NirQ/NorQ/GpvN family protein [Akkermansiaceae bacterium]